MNALKEQNSDFRNGKVALGLKIEPSYLSRFLSDDKVHFSEELLYQLLVMLKLSQAEIDQIFLYREFERASCPDRKNYLKAKIKLLKCDSWRLELCRLKTDLNVIIEMIDQSMISDATDEFFTDKDSVLTEVM